MKFTYIFTRRGRMALAAALGLFIAAPAVSEGAIVALKEDDAALDYSIEGQYSTSPAGGDFGVFTQFNGLTTADVVEVHVDDILLSGGADTNLGQEFIVNSTGNTANLAVLMKWDLSSLPGFAGSTVNAAVIRFYQTNGQGIPKWSAVTTHDYDEATVTPGSPSGNPVAGTASGVGDWGPALDSPFTFAGDASVETAVPLDNTVVGRGYTTFNVLADVTAMAAGTPNYGWAGTTAYPGTTGNHPYVSSENPNPIFGTAVGATAPVLFIDYTPVPEPTSMVLLGMAAFGLTTIRKRK